MGNELPPENLKEQGERENFEAEQVQPDLSYENTEIQEKKTRLKKIEDAMKHFVASGLVLFAVGGAFEAGARVMGVKPEGKKVNLEKVEEIQYRDGVIKSEELRSFFDSMPENWAYGEIVSIEGQEKSAADRTDFNVFMHYGRGDLKIVFDKSDMKNFSKNEVLGLISHELAHANDYQSDNELNSAEKSDLRDKIAERLDASDRMLSMYVEMLIADGAPHGQVIGEFWAELCRAYMMDPTQLNIEEFKLVDDFVKKNDPNYNWKESIQKRWDIAYSK